MEGGRGRGTQGGRGGGRALEVEMGGCTPGRVVGAAVSRGHSRSSWYRSFDWGRSDGSILAEARRSGCPAVHMVRGVVKRDVALVVDKTVHVEVDIVLLDASNR